MSNILKPTGSLYFSIGANIALIFSIGVNVALVTSLAYPSIQRAEPIATALNQGLAPQKAHLVSTDISAAVAVPPIQPRFEWQQLESDDYPTYIANLRSVGVPEPALRSIIAAEIAGEYEGKRQKITAQRASTEAARMQKQQLLEQLSREQTEVVTGLLNRPSSPGKLIPTGRDTAATILSPRTTSTSHGQTSQIQAQDPVNSKTAEVQRAASLPAALVPANPAISLNEIQVAEWENLQNAFKDAVTQSNQDPTDPDYLAKWNEEQKLSDNLFRAKNGTRAYVLQNLQVGHQDQ